VLWTKGLTLRAIIAGSRAHLAAATKSFATHLLRPAISRVFPFAEARQAYRYYESTNPFGKVVIAHNLGGEQQ
jgi:NADPH:quinone reductase-like Zn-dependent oxidoreductase